MLLSDTREVLGTWVHHIPYLTQDFTPKARVLGLRKTAFVCGPTKLSEQSANTQVSKLLTAATFHDEATAIAWLLSEERH